MTVLTTDALADAGMEAVGLSGGTLSGLFAAGLPPGASMGKALDMPMGALSKSAADDIASIVSAIAADAKVDLVLAHLNLATFLHYAEPLALAATFASSLVTATMNGKPLYVGLRDSTDPDVAAIRSHLVDACSKAAVPCFTGPVEAARAAGAAWRRSAFLQRDDGLVPPPLPLPAQDRIGRILAAAQHDGRTLLTQLEAFDVLAARAIGHPPVALAKDRREAVSLAKAIGFPVALKVESADIIHKSERGGVRLGIASEQSVERHYDAIVASANAMNANLAGVVVQRMCERGRSS